MTIFLTEARKYWAMGLQAIPLYSARKRPCINGWQKYAKEPITLAEMQEWENNFPDGNIGLALGTVSGLTMMDLDVSDQALINVIMGVLPPSPWERVGKKGSVLAYRFSGHKTFRIKNAQGETLVECLSSGTQVVLPPSIHPDTQLPYKATGALYDPAILAQVVPLPPDIEAILRSALQAHGIKLSLGGHTKVIEWVANGSRDTKMIQVAGLWAREVLKGSLTFAQAINDMHAWEQTQVEQVAGDQVDINKGIATMAKFLLNDVISKNKSLPKGWDDGLSSQEKTDLGFDALKEEHTPWDFDRIKDYIRDQFMIHEAGTQGRRVAVDYAIRRIANSKLNNIELMRLTDYIAPAGQMGDKGSTLRAEIKRLQSQGVAGTDQTEIAKAVIEDLNAIGELRFIGGGFWQWAGSNWEELRPSQILQIIGNKYGTLSTSKRHGDHIGIFKIMQSQVEKELTSIEATGVNFANGFLDERLQLLDHNPEYGATYTLPFRYTNPEEDYLPQGPAPMFTRFVKSCWQEDPDFLDKVIGLRQAIAMTLFGAAPRWEKVFLMFGAPRTGKSQMLKIIENLLPSNMQTAIKPEQWGDKFLPAQFFGKLINVCGELSESRNIEGTLFKQIVSGETIEAQHKNQMPFKFQPRCAHWFASNHLPRTQDTSDGFNRRWIIFQFNKPVTDDEKILDLGSIIAAEEREAIASWAVQAFPSLLANRGIHESSSHRELIEDVGKQNNSVLQFMKDGKAMLAQDILTNSSTLVAEKDIYNAYFTFAIQAGVAKAVSQTSFRQKMGELGSQLGFKLIRVKNSLGATDCFYTSSTPATNVEAKSLN